MLFYRVLPYLADARPHTPGHPLFIPPGGAGRVDNPGRYDTLYVGDTAAGAVAEAFGWAGRWDGGLLRGLPTLPGSVRAVVSYEAPDTVAVCDLDDAERLVEFGLRPSRVVSRDRVLTQASAARIYQMRAFAGVRWWSYYDPRWGSFGLWDAEPLRVVEVSALTLDHAALVEAAGVLLRPLG